MTTDATLRYLYDLQLFGIKSGLANIRALVRVLGHPERSYATVHVAGTNGKGSTSAMIAAALRAAGYRTGLYTSPHLVRFAERIRVDGRPIPDRAIARLTRRLRGEIDRRRATFFEATTAIAFAYFAEERVDVAVIETGLGGRLDATNVVLPRLSVITGIALDHTEHLGTTIAAIAGEKAGIIKPKVPVVVGELAPAARRVIVRAARAAHAPLLGTPEVRAEGIDASSLDGVRFTVRHPLAPFGTMFVSMPGAHQARNAALALASLGALRDAGFARITPAAVAAGWADVRSRSGLRGRIDVLSRDPLIVADAGHNADGLRASAAALRRLLVGRSVVVFGAMQDKDARAMAAALAPISRLVVIVRPRTSRSAEPAALLAEFRRCGVRALDGGGVAEGMRRALQERRGAEAVVVTGSHYVLGEAIGVLPALARASRGSRRGAGHAS